MDFFKSLVLDDPAPSQPESHNGSQPTVDQDDDQFSDAEDGEDDNDDGRGNGDGGLWSFGGLIQSIATRSESVIETYRRDLQEFGSGLKKETEMFREAASKAVKDLPAEIDGVIKSTAEIISHGTDSILAPSDDGSGDVEAMIRKDSVRYSRFEAQLSVVQSDVRTFVEDPEDVEEFGRWKLGFALIDKGEEIEGLIGGSGVLEGMFKRLVPSEVDNETFWFRYFYRVHKLRQQENVRANLVRRAISIDEEEELSWDVDDDEEDDDEEDDDENVGEHSVVKGKGDELVKKEKGDELVKKEEGEELDKKKDSSDEDSIGIEKESHRKDESFNVSDVNIGESKSNVESASRENAGELKSKDESGVKNDEKLVKLEDSSEVKKDERVEKNEEKAEKSEEKKPLEGKGDQGGLGKETPVSVKSSKHSTVEDEDLEWDEIEDVDSNDEKKPSAVGEKSSQSDLRKRLSTTEDDEDLSWDIEDDDD